MPATAVVDTRSPLDAVGEAWLHRQRPTISSPIRPTGALLLFDQDTPPVLGSLGLIPYLSDTQDRTRTLSLPSVLVVASDHIPHIVGLQTCARRVLLIDAAASSVSVEGSAISLRCSLFQRRHLPPPLPPAGVHPVQLVRAGKHPLSVRSLGRRPGRHRLPPGHLHARTLPT